MDNPIYKLVVFDLANPTLYEYAVKKTITEQQFRTLSAAEPPGSLMLNDRFCTVEGARSFFHRDVTGYTGFVVLDVRYKTNPIVEPDKQLELFK